MNLKRWQPVLPALALPLLTLTGMAQTTGVSHPDDPTLDVAQTASPASTADHYVPPSKTAAAARSTAPVAQPYQGQPANSGEAVAYSATGPAPIATPAQTAPGLIVRQPASALPTTSTTYGPVEPARARQEALASAGNDDDIVTEVPAGPFELPSGAVLKTRLDTVLGTDTTPVGSPFNAQLLTDAGHHGKVLLPAGSVIHGRVTAAHGGRRITGGAAIRLQPETVTLPDGTSYPLRATVTAIQSDDNLKVNDEGVINSRGNTKATLGVIGGTTAVAAVAGAVVGGGLGAAVGAGIGAGVGTIVWLKQDHQATLPTGTTLFFALDDSLQLTPR